MGKNHYYFNLSTRGYCFEDAGTNKRKAIKIGRELAARMRQTIQLWQARVIDKGDTRLGRYYVGALEFPYSLGNCPIGPEDIVVNI